MAFVLPTSEHAVNPVRSAGLALLLVMAIGVLCLAVARRSAGEPANVVPAGGYSVAVAQGAAAIVSGKATFYADAFQGRTMASGKPFDMNDLSIAAANQWPLGTRLRLQRAPGGPWDSTLTPDERAKFFSRSIIVTVQDHGDFTHALDLSRAAFAQLGRPDEGVITLLIVPLGDGSDAPVVVP